MIKEIDISVIIPLLNEKESLEELYLRLRNVLDSTQKEYELIFVDDGSRDSSFSLLKALHEKDFRVKIIQLRRNFGKAAALTAGFKQSQGQTVFTMDADLQDDPKEIPRFLDKMSEGYDLICGWKARRRDPISKKLASKIFNIITSVMSGVKIHDFNCGFKCYRKEVIESIRIYGELYRYIPVLVAWKGFKIGEIKVEHHHRKFGKSKYGIGRLNRGLFDFFTVLFITRYIRRPLHFFGISGILVSGVGFLICLYLSILWFSGQLIGNRPLLLLGVLLLILGVNFISIGLIGEMIVSKFPEEREEYLIKQKYL